MTTLQFQNQDARIAALAVVYHLGRPGSEIDPESGGQHQATLRPLLAGLRAQLAQAVVTIEATADQVQRLDRALLGASNELRQYALSGVSVVPGFADQLGEFWPDLAEDPGGVADLVGHVVILRRRLDAVFVEAGALLVAESAAREAERQARRGRWWQVWRREG